MAKKVICILTAVMLIFALAACGQTTPNENNETN